MTASLSVCIAERLLGRPLAIHPGRLEALIASTALHLDEDFDFDDPEEEPEQDPIAIIRIKGVLSSREDRWLSWMGWTSYEALIALAREHLEDDAILGVLLDIDSPGGDVQGLPEAVEAIAELAAAKPVFAVAEHNAFSAAYSLAAAAGRIFVSSTSGVGSVGVLATRLDRTAQDEMIGLKFHLIHAGERKVDGQPHTELSDKGRTQIQGEVDRLHNLLAEGVAFNRRMTTEAVKATQAGTFHGQEAIGIGFADALGNKEQALAELALAASVETDTGTPFGRRRAFPARRSA